MCNRYFNFAGFITEKVLKYDIDDTDLHILSYMYMIQASKNIVRIQVNENYYYWITYEKIINDNPTLRLKRRALENRMAHLTQIGLVEKINKNFNTKKTYFSTTEKFEDLMFVTTESNSNEQNEDIFSIQQHIEENQKPKVDEKQELEIQAIFELWNKQKIIVHKELTDKIRKEIIKALKTNDFETIKTCILRYNEALKSGFKLCQYKWTLDTFLKQKNAMIDFIDEGSKWNSYQDWLKQPRNKPYSPYEDLPEDGYGEYGVKI